jgi:hypothetical protein
MINSGSYHYPLDKKKGVSENLPPDYLELRWTNRSNIMSLNFKAKDFVTKHE